MPDIDKHVYTYIVDHQGKFNIVRCAAELNLDITDVKAAIATLQETGKIRKSDEQRISPYEKLIHDKKVLKKELENLSEQLAAGDLTSSQYEINCAAVKKKIERLERKLKALRKSKSVSGLPEPDTSIKPEMVAELIKKRDSITGWIDNLTTGKESVAESSYSKVIAEYQSRLDVIKTSIAESVGKLLNLWENNKRVLEALTSDLEDLAARTVSGEIEEKYSNVKRQELESKIRHITQEIELTEQILSKTGS